jgi:hypothetical protein
MLAGFYKCEGNGTKKLVLLTRFLTRNKKKEIAIKILR